MKKKPDQIDQTITAIERAKALKPGEVPGLHAYLQAGEVSHLAYLKFRLVPDLKESGMTATAEDFETCIAIGERLLGRPITMNDWI